MSKYGIPAVELTNVKMPRKRRKRVERAPNRLQLGLFWVVGILGFVGVFVLLPLFSLRT